MAEGETLESWLNKATNPANRQEDWEYIIGFCDQVNKELEGPQIAVRLLAHKIQSPQEWEAVQTLTVLEACMKNCGRRFHNEVGKFRFLNELIKVVSPKYLGDRVSEKVKAKVIELLYSWTVALPEEIKIKDAYQMLKKQGILQHDPQIPVDKTLIPSPPTRPKNAVFEDNEKSKLLARLLKSKNPEDLQEANKLIKNMVKEDEARMQKITKRLNTLEEVNNNVRLLNEMLAHYSKEESTEGDKELMTELYERCEKMRRTLFKLASETEDNDNSLGEILRASDDLSRAINSYKKIVQGQAVNGELDLPELPKPSVSSGASNTETLIDLAGLDVPSAKANPTAAPVFPIIPPPPHISNDLSSRSASLSNVIKPPPSSVGLLDVELLSLGLNDPPLSSEIDKDSRGSLWNGFQVETAALNPFAGPPAADGQVPSMTLLVQSVPWTLNQPSAQSLLSFPGLSLAPHTPTIPLLLNAASTISSMSQSNSASAVQPPLHVSRIPGAPVHSDSCTQPALSSSMCELDVLGQKVLEEVKGASGVMGIVSGLPAGSGYSTPSAAPGSPLFRSLSPQPSSPLRSVIPDMSLSNVTVPLETIKPSSILPVTAYDKNGFRILLHFAKDCPPTRLDVLVIVISMISTSPLPITNVVLQAAVPKTMKVKLQPPSGTELAPFNPVLPPASITQVMLLANPLKEKVRLRYKLTFTMGQQTCSEMAEVDQFPPAEKWGYL
ncbi:ADP-ribosylation factor-binding protein GGA3 isoform X1 [Carcharodon carcharias]|uniref:ADP-ribosylation factor-binding protein GGA3 isoform X1 n=3 Tax=Carcharodon carcharias TaxID=13397 RepID=UPI001B7F6349|nr:ADP-ribosylation factor-binding protein GGA3 isoform X1 [Carcharodon carcharias]